MGAGEGQLSQEDIDALLGGGGSDEGDGGDPFGGLGDDSGGGDDSVGMPSDDILAAALGTGSTPPPPPPKPQGVKKSPGMGGNNANLNLLMDVTMALTVELGRKDMFIRDVLQLAGRVPCRARQNRRGRIRPSCKWQVNRKGGS